ncbi:MAG: cellulose synthase operon protein YhjQ/BcsQ, partial [Desulfovibrionaceae bacterium]|nr:cellulose synthase operon protein YhjQ/BcsQ [Desulfovibrionaceae bacterium]
SGVPELVEMDEDMQAMLFDKLKDLVNKYHFLILDLGAGITSTVLSFASMTQARLLVITPEPTSLTDGYAMIKVLSAQYGVRDFCVIVNQASSPKEAKETFKRLDMACRKFLDIEITGLGSVSQDENMIEAVRNQVPLLKFAPGCRASQDISSLAKKLLRYRQDNEEAISGRPALKNFPSLETRR